MARLENCLWKTHSILIDEAATLSDILLLYARKPTSVRAATEAANVEFTVESRPQYRELPVRQVARAFLLAGAGREQANMLYEPGSKLSSLHSIKGGCSMSIGMLKPLQNDAGHSKKDTPKRYLPDLQTIRGTLNGCHHYYRQVMLTPARIGTIQGLYSLFQTNHQQSF